ncbi:MAG: vitamin K epoxide reductase family protein [Fidelibacterota bacterium]
MSVYLIGALLALVGGALSFYFYGVYRHIFSGKDRWMPTICHIDEKTCLSIIETSYGRIGGIPNALSGSVFLFIYSAVLTGTFFLFIPVYIPLLMGLFTVIIGIYLIYGLTKLHARCTICLTVHLVNFIIFILQLISIN